MYSIRELHAVRLRLSHVCHYWRSIILHKPDIWRHIYLGGNDSVAEQMAHSRQMYLDVGGHITAWNEPSLHRLLKEWTRIRSLSLDFYFPWKMDPTSSQEILPLNWINPPPRSSWTDLPLATILPLQSYSADHLDKKSSKYLSIFERCSLPDLQTLRLTRCTVGIPDSMFTPTLTRIELKQSSIGLPRLIRALSDMPSLKHLILDVLWYRDDQPPAEGSIGLPSLEQLEFGIRKEAERPIYTELFTRLRFPSTARIHIQVYRVSYDSGSFMPVRLDGAYLTAAAAYPIRSLSISSIHQSRVQIAAWEETIDFDGQLSWTDVESLRPLMLIEHWHKGLEHAREDCKDVDFLSSRYLQHVEIAHLTTIVTSFVYNDRSLLKEEAWLDIFSHLDNLRMLYFGGQPVKFLPSLLGEYNEPEGFEPRRLVPRLTTIHIRDFYVRTDWEIEKRARSMWVEGLLVVLRERRDTGYAVQKMTFQTCDRVNGGDIKLLKEVVPEVEWDGRSEIGVFYQ